MNLIDLSSLDLELLEKLKTFLATNYVKGRHHVATVLKTNDGREYFALHLDIQGFDVCAEPIALSNALVDKPEGWNVIMSVIQTAHGPTVVNPCGNCRQMFTQYAPEIEVVIAIDQEIKKVKAIELLPYPYSL